MATRRGYMSDVTLFARWLHARRKDACVAADVREVDVRAWRDELLDVERRRASTVNRRLQALRAFYRIEVRRGSRKDNPADGVHLIRSVPRLRPLSLTEDEVHRLLIAAGRSAQPIRNLALAHVLLQTGLRVGEVHRLVVSDLTLRDRSGQVRVRGKGMRERLVPLNARSRRPLARYLTETVPRAQDSPVFLSNREAALAERSIQHTVAKLAKDAHIDRLPVGPHTLRHTFAINYLNANPGGLVELAGLLGHVSLDTTAVYLRPSMADLEEGVERAAR